MSLNNVREEDEQTQTPLLWGGHRPSPKIVEPRAQESKFYHRDHSRERSETNKMSAEPPKQQTGSKDICGEMVGEFGWWQLRATMIIYLMKIPAAWFMACVIFTAPAPRYGEYWCAVPDFVEEGNHSVWLNVSHPTAINSDGTFESNYCYVYHDAEEKWMNWTEGYEANGTEREMVHCVDFQHGVNPQTSVITQFDLVCSKTILVAITQCFHLFGVLVGGILVTELLKIFNPRSMMLVGLITQTWCGIGAGLSPWFWMHAVMRAAAAACTAIAYTPGAMVFSDITGGRYKTIVAGSFEQFWSVGVILLPAIGYFSQNWTQVYYGISFPSIIIIILWWWIPDSPRWHLAKGNVKKAEDIIEQAVKTNNGKTEIPSNLNDILKTQALGAIVDKNVAANAGWRNLLSLSKASQTIAASYIGWALMYTCYYGTLLNIRSFGRDYIYANTAIAGLCELIGGFIGLLIILYVKRKWQFVGGFTVITAIPACFIWFMRQKVDGSHYLLELMIVQMLNKTGISACLCVLTTCTAELFPARHKKRGVYGATVFARIIFLTAPLIGATIEFGDAVPLTAYAALAIVGGFCTMTLSPVEDDKNNNSKSDTKIPHITTKY